MDSFAEFWPIISSGGAPALGLLIVMWIVRGTLIPKRHHQEIVQGHLRNIESSDRRYEEMRLDRDHWRTEATQKTSHVDRALVVAEAGVKVANGEN